MEPELQSEKLKFFIRTGIVVLTFLVILVLGIKYIPQVVTVTNSANAKKLPIYSVATNENKVALTFDAAWGNGETDEILAKLAKYNIKATFFMTGNWVEKYPEDVKLIVNAGHDIGNHSENHKHMSQLTKEQSIEEIKKVHEKVKGLTNIEMNLFRPPYGDYNNTLIETANEIGYHCVKWNVDSNDWRDYGVDSIIDHVVNNENLDSGSIILMHIGAKYTVDALEAVISGLQDKGYKIVPVSELIYTDNYYMGTEGRQFSK